MGLVAAPPPLALRIVRYDPQHRTKILDLTLRAWGPVFAGMEAGEPGFVYDALYPAGWSDRQAADIAVFLDAGHDPVWVALDAETVVGWIGVRLRPADSTGEVYILAVDPERQRQGVARALIEAALAGMRDAGMTIATVETGDDLGHASSRATYESAGFERWSVAGYFRKL